MCVALQPCCIVLPAVQVLDDAVRAVLCPDKLSAAEWLEVVEAAHGGAGQGRGGGGGTVHLVDGMRIGVRCRNRAAPPRALVRCACRRAFPSPGLPHRPLPHSLPPLHPHPRSMVGLLISCSPIAALPPTPTPISTVGLRTTSTIMFGHVDGPAHWARHLAALRALQASMPLWVGCGHGRFLGVGAPWQSCVPCRPAWGLRFNRKL